MTLRLQLLLATLALSSFTAACGVQEAEIAGDDTSGEEVAPPATESAVSQELRAAPLGPTPSGKALRYPIVFVHGFTASRDIGGFSSAIQDALRDDGHFVYHASVPPYLPPEQRAPLLATQVDDAMKKFCEARHPSQALATCLSNTKVNLITHSMGGLDARVLISGLGYGDRVASLTTISAPHQGSAMADATLEVLGGHHTTALDAVAAAVASLYSDAPSQADLKATLVALSEKEAAEFNAKYVDDPRVHYYSYAGTSYLAGVSKAAEQAACEGKVLGDSARRDIMNPAILALAPFVAHGTEFRPNDGLVTVESAKHGEFLGCVPADHLDEVYQPELFRPSWWTGFDNVRFYRNVAYGLAAKGF